MPHHLPAFLPRTLALTGLIALAAGLGPIACERHPAGHPSDGYGHGSARQDSKAGDTHAPDGRGTRFSDSQGVGKDAANHSGQGGDHGAEKKH